MIPGEWAEVSTMDISDVERRGAKRGAAAYRVATHTGCGAGLLVVGAAGGPSTLMVCAVLAAVVMLAGLALPQRSEDRLRLWLALVARSGEQAWGRDERGDQQSSPNAPVQ